MTTLLVLGLLYTLTETAKSNNTNEEFTNSNSSEKVSLFELEEKSHFVTQKAYEQEKPPLQKRAKVTPRYQCVVYVRMVTGNPLVKGTAKTVPTNSEVPMIGAIVKTNESKYGHVAVVEDIKDGYIILSEANVPYSKSGGPVVTGRKIAINSKKIVGYLIP